MWILVIASLFVLIAESPAKNHATLAEHERALRPNEILANHMRNVLAHMTALKVSVHPRIRHLYELLQRDIEYGRRVSALHAGPQGPRDLPPPPRRPGYDIYKLNRMLPEDDLQERPQSTDRRRPRTSLTSEEVVRAGADADAERSDLTNPIDLKLMLQGLNSSFISSLFIPVVRPVAGSASVPTVSRIVHSS
ncbi:unnamed protein product [Chrysodeixis includens]|uniref:Uncharacterized protein n=1 Tax=Chrysodeixis includens TaxID=689277 RepID=A0A9N8Q2Y2_CHRIL|nr:unnamed protein product [Chrysodeixis includens]